MYLKSNIRYKEIGPSIKQINESPRRNWWYVEFREVNIKAEFNQQLTKWN